MKLLLIHKNARVFTTRSAPTDRSIKSKITCFTLPAKRLQCQRSTHIVHARRYNDENAVEERRASAKQRTEDQIVVYTVAIALTSLIALSAKYGGDIIDNLDAFNGYYAPGFTLGDTAGGILWSISYYFVSPIQLLLLFLGRIETERPSDFLLNTFGKLLNLDIDAIDYKAPPYLIIATIMICTLGGFLTSIAFQSLLDDSTWAVSTGIGACFAAAIYEVGRPERLSTDEAITLENQWQDFASFADEKLERSLSARCHESEVFQAFRRQYGRYRDSSVVSDARLRDMVKNWHPAVVRSRTGWYKGLSFRKYDSSNSESGSIDKSSNVVIEESSNSSNSSTVSVVVE